MPAENRKSAPRAVTVPVMVRGGFLPGSGIYHDDYSTVCRLVYIKGSFCTETGKYRLYRDVICLKISKICLKTAEYID